MTDKEVMQMALDCLLAWEKEEVYGWGETDHKCVEALRAALTQPKREWVGLTDEEVDAKTWDILIKRSAALNPVKDFAEIIEAKLKDKNT